MAITLFRCAQCGAPVVKRTRVRKKYSLARHRLAARQPRHHLGRAVAQAVALHLDQRAVVGADHVMRGDVEHAVGARDLPVDAAFDQRSAVQLRPAHRAAASGT